MLLLCIIFYSDIIILIEIINWQRINQNNRISLENCLRTDSPPGNPSQSQHRVFHRSFHILFSSYFDNPCLWCFCLAFFEDSPVCVPTHFVLVFICMHINMLFFKQKLFIIQWRSQKFLISKELEEMMDIHKQKHYHLQHYFQIYQ